MATNWGKVIERRDANPCKEDVRKAIARIRESEGRGLKSWCQQKRNSNEISVQVYLYDHLVMEFVYYASETSIFFIVSCVYAADEP